MLDIRYSVFIILLNRRYTHHHTQTKKEPLLQRPLLYYVLAMINELLTMNQLVHIIMQERIIITYLRFAFAIRQ